MNPPKLTEKQFDLIKNADFDQLFIWYNELYPGTKINTEINKLFIYINKEMEKKSL